MLEFNVMTKCTQCRRPISGEYVQALGRAWHPACFRCAVCGKAFVDQHFSARDGKPYHDHCYEEAFSPRCAACDRPIRGEYVTALGKTWHPEHFVCTTCKKPFGKDAFVKHRGRPYHERCYLERFAPRCDVCGASIRGPYVTTTTGETFCEHHKGEIPECSSCGRLASDRLTGGFVRYQDGRVICNLCRPAAVDRELEGQRLLSDVRRALAKEGLTLGKVKVPLRLVDQDELNRRVKRRRSKTPAGMVRSQLTTQGDKVVERKVVEILALRGLPRDHLAAVLAHEVGHAWLLLNDYPKLPPKVEEGICELFSYLWLKGQPGEGAARRILLLEKNRDRVYGVGFRAVRRALRQRSVKRLLAYVKRYGRFPK